MKNSKQGDSTEAMGLTKRERFDSSKGAQTGNDKGNQAPSGNPVGPKPAKK
jgi:hypothetical protein